MRRFRFEQQQGQQQHCSACFYLHAECRHSQGQPFGWRITSNRLFRDHRQRWHGSGCYNGSTRRRYRLILLCLRSPNGTASASITAVFLCCAGNLYPDFHRNRFYAADAKRDGFLNRSGCCRTLPPPRPHYSLSISGPSQLVKGGTATATLTATYVGGFDSPVSVAPVFLPTGISITSGPIVFTAANLSQTVTFAASSSTALATYPAVFTGTGGDLPAQTVSFSLTVVAPPPCLGLCIHHNASRHKRVCFSGSRGSVKSRPGLSFPSDRYRDRECRRPKLTMYLARHSILSATTQPTSTPIR